ncbi:MAG TPA: response regulator transcription factor [Herpetosiphonaceae bacterium]
MTKLRIFLAEDHGIVRQGLKTLINVQADMEVIGEAGDGLSAIQQVQTYLPDVVVMDISMPMLNGVRATRQIKLCCPDIKILVLSAHEEKSYLREMLAAGATGYVLKRAVADDLIQAIRVVAAGGVYLDSSLASTVMRSFVQGTSRKREAQRMALSEREEDVARLIAQGYTIKEIATQLNLSIKTVDTYKTRAMEKLGLDSRVALVRYALQHGWLQPE